MSVMPTQVSSGLLAEARAYFLSLRGSLAKLENAPDRDILLEAQRQAQVLATGAEMIGLAEVAALASPASAILDSCVDQQRELDPQERQQLAEALDRIAPWLDETSDKDDSNSSAREPVAGIVLDTSHLRHLPPELLEIFTQEASEHFEAIRAGLEHLRVHPDDDQALSEVRRVTHTLKGAAASIGLDGITRVAHLMEDLTERHLERSAPLTQPVVELLLDSADALEGFLAPDDGTDLGALIRSIDDRYDVHLGVDHTSLEVADPAPDGGGMDAVRPAPRAENILRVPMAIVDGLINHIGEIVINRSISEKQVEVFRDLLSELDYSARRLNQVASDIDAQVVTTPRLDPGDPGGENQAYTMFDPLELDRYSQLHQFTRELVEVAGDTGDVNNKLHLLADNLEGALARERHLTTRLQEDLLATRLVPFRELETRLRRTVHRTARDVGKTVELTITGLEIDIDKSILNALIDPLTHLLRNAVDHGIEDADTRQREGKPEVGQITLRVWRERGRVLLRLADDGKGIDLSGVRKRAHDRGLLARGSQGDERQLLDFLFAEGFSLANSITETSGRGLGLNIVRRAVSELQGTIQVETAQGRGAAFIISAPVTLAITRALFVTVGQHSFAVPLPQIISVIRLEAEAYKEIREQKVLRVANRPLGVYSLASYVGGNDDETSRYGLVIDSHGEEVVVLVDALAGTSDTVIKSLGNHLKRVHGVSGATITGDGRVVLILDLPELIAPNRPALSAPPPLAASRASQEKAWRVLVVDDSLSVRRVVCAFLERQGWQAVPARDGIEALEQIEAMRPDVALVDIEMPRMNGYELLSRIKSDANLRDIPVVFLTSRSAAKHRERAAQLGVDGYLVKPYRDDSLLEELRRALAVKHA